MDTDDLRAVARKRLKAQADFKNYLLVWGAVSIVLVVVWALTNPGGFFWPVWPIAGMGIAALFTGIAAYGPERGVISEERVDAEVRRMTKGS